MRIRSFLPLLALITAACGESTPAPTTTSLATTPTYYRDVEPILQTRCAGCHSADGIAPFAFEMYEDARSRAALVADLVERRVMPPWPPSSRGVPLLHSRALGDEQIRSIVDWARAGAPEGSIADHQERTPEKVAVRHDLRVDMAETYTPNAALSDDYRCYVIDHGRTDTPYLTGYDVVPGTPGVHHVILFLVQAEAVPALRALDAADPAYGYTCFGGIGVEDAGPGPLAPVRVLGGWAPGSGASPMPAGTGLPIPPGSLMVMQVHYNTARSTQPDQTHAFLELSTGAELSPALVLALAHQTFSVPPGARDHVVEASAAAGSPAILHAVYPHMHLHGTSISVSLARPSGETVLVDIPRWDFHWQGGYVFASPERLSVGDTLKLRCVYDNSSGTVPLRWGEGTADEMCLAFLYFTAP
jgi:hypothetical protein